MTVADIKKIKELNLAVMPSSVLYWENGSFKKTAVKRVFVNLGAVLPASIPSEACSASWG